jgi:hypothetical protein
MSEIVIDEINQFKTFRYNDNVKKIENLKFKEETDIDEFLNIQHLLDKNRVHYRFEKNFEIKILK